MASAPDAMKSATLISIPAAVTAQKADSRIDLAIKFSGLKKLVKWRCLAFLRNLDRVQARRDGH